MVVEIDADDRMSAGFGGELDDVQTDAAGAENGDAFADGELGVVVDHSEGGGDGAAEQSAGFGIEIGGDFSDAIFGNDRVFAEGGNPAGIYFWETFGLVSRRGSLKAGAFTPMADDAVAGFDG